MPGPRRPINSCIALDDYGSPIAHSRTTSVLEPPPPLSSPRWPLAAPRTWPPHLLSGSPFFFRWDAPLAHCKLPTAHCTLSLARSLARHVLTGMSTSSNSQEVRQGEYTFLILFLFIPPKPQGQSRISHCYGIVPSTAGIPSWAPPLPSPSPSGLGLVHPVGHHPRAMGRGPCHGPSLPLHPRLAGPFPSSHSHLLTVDDHHTCPSTCTRTCACACHCQY
ncbi:hypothetical protein QBC39DRAFT_7300 [Podospora conica]|nr:hypothetical protein QBC39DRAFT_7300 [Schizothecium conicum]